MNEKTPSRTSPQGGNRGCLCEDGTYSIDCCDGSLQAQGVGSLVDGGIVNLTQNIIERTITSGQPSAIPILDTYPNAKVGYSLRLLSSDYTGFCIRVRRSSDNAEQDIGFDGNELDTSSLLSFCGVNSGYVTTWYNQKNTGDNLNNSTAIYQPLIVLNGALQMVNGKPAIYGDANATLYAGNTTTFKFMHDGSIKSCVLSVLKTNIDISPLRFFYLTGTSGGTSVEVNNNFRSNQFRQRTKNGTVSIDNNDSASANAQQTIFQTYDVANPTPQEKMSWSINNGTDVKNNTSSFTPSTANSTRRLSVLNYYASVVGFGLNGFLQEFIIWDFDYSADKEDINTDVNNHYEIY